MPEKVHPERTPRPPPKKAVIKIRLSEAFFCL
jgi:hypothetical protein